jgi:ABC-2 type transport system permease protein
MVANSELQRVGLSGWRTGLANLMHKENRAWWASRRQLVQSLLWAVVVNGFVALLIFVVLPYGREMSPTLEGFDDLATGADLLFKLGLLALAFRTIVLAQDEILGERQLGVTEWLLSKPVSRPAYVLSKLLAHGLGVLVILVGLQGALGYGLLSLILGEPFPLPPYLVGMAGLAVHTLFYLALTLMMGVLTANRRMLLGVSQGVLLGGMLTTNFLGTAVMLTPWGLVQVLHAAVLGMPLPLPVWLPIGVTASLTVICVAVALARFERLEF